MANTTPTSQKRALERYRARLAKSGMARFEVLGLKSDRELVRSIARRLAGKNKDATRLRRAVADAGVAHDSDKGEILAWLRRSPLVGADLDLKRERTPGRKVDL